MAQSFTPGLACLPRSVQRRHRALPVPGEILVSVGAKVEADAVVARASLPGELIICRVAETLGIEPFEVVAGMKVALGAEVREGALLCEHRGLFGLFRSRFLAPASGTIELILEHTGHIGIRLASKFFDLRAYCAGTVVAIEEKRSVTIETEGAFVQGIFGVGGERTGVIRSLSVSPDQGVTESDLPQNLQGAVLVGGTAPSLGALRKAAAGGAVGFVTGSIDDKTIAGYLGYDLGIALTGNEAVPMTVIVTEGFGKIPMGAKAARLLKAADGRNVSINGATQVRAGAVRPEILIPGPVLEGADAGPTAAGVSGLEVGATVRVIRVPYFGAIGSVIALPSELREIPTGAHVRTAVVQFSDGTQTVIPRANLELQW